MVTTRICIDAVKLHEYAKITVTHTVDAAIIRYLYKFKLKGNFVLYLDPFEKLSLLLDVHLES